MRIPAAALVAAALAACGGAERPAAPTTTPTATPASRPPGLAASLATARADALHAVDAWLRDGDPARGQAPSAVAAPARRAQAIYRRLGAHPRLAARALARLDGAAHAEAADIVAAQRALRTLNAPFRHAHVRIRLGPPAPAGALLRFYREGRRRSGVAWQVLAAVNLVESSFGRLRNASPSGAQGPMQFMPSTWRAYGRGDVHDPHDAILAAARFLHAAGAPRDERRALYRYNPSPLYVTAVRRYARVIRRDPRAFYVLYAWRAPTRR